MGKVSVIIPVYNLENLIERCLNSVLSQTYKDIEIITVDDGSVDKSAEIIKNLMKENKNIVYRYKENGGQSTARNLGLKIATGDYILFIDGDDWIENSMIEEMMEPFARGDYDVVICDYYRDYENESIYTKSIERYSDNKKINYILSAVSVWNKIFKREVLEGHYFIEGINYEDLAFVPFVNSKVSNYYYIEKPFYRYYIRSDSTMHKESFSAKEYDIFKALEFLSDNMDKEYAAEVEYIYILHLLYANYLRFLRYPLSETKEIRKRARNMINERYPAWKKNKYLTSKKQKIVTALNFHGLDFLVKPLLSIQARIRRIY